MLRVPHGVSSQLAFYNYIDIQHHMYRIMYQGELFLAPIDLEKLERVLDAGTGTGIWAMDFGKNGARPLATEPLAYKPNLCSG